MNSGKIGTRGTGSNDIGSASSDKPTLQTVFDRTFVEKLAKSNFKDIPALLKFAKDNFYSDPQLHLQALEKIKEKFPQVKDDHLVRAKNRKEEVRRSQEQTAHSVAPDEFGTIVFREPTISLGDALDKIIKLLMNSVQQDWEQIPNKLDTYLKSESPNVHDAMALAKQLSSNPNGHATPMLHAAALRLIAVRFPEDKTAQDLAAQVAFAMATREERSQVFQVIGETKNGDDSLDSLARRILKLES